MKNFNRTERIPVSVSKNEKEIITKKAHQSNMVVAEFVRFLALNYVPVPSPVDAAPVVSAQKEGSDETN